MNNPENILSSAGKTKKSKSAQDHIMSNLKNLKDKNTNNNINQIDEE